MNQLILRIKSNCKEIDMLNVDIKGNEIFSQIDMKDCLRIINESIYNNLFENEKYTFLSDGIIAYSNNSVVIKQPGHKRIVTYQGKAYNINFPNSIYILYYTNVSVTEIAAYAYKEYEGINTELFLYPMPNMLSQNKICIGSADRKLVDYDFIEALERIIYAEYTHSFVHDIKSFKNTEAYFNYLSENDFPYDLLIDSKKKLGNVLNLMK